MNKFWNNPVIDTLVDATRKAFVKQGFLDQVIVKGRDGGFLLPPCNNTFGFETIYIEPVCPPDTTTEFSIAWEVWNENQSDSIVFKILREGNKWGTPKGIGNLLNDPDALAAFVNKEINTQARDEFEPVNLAPYCFWR